MSWSENEIRHMRRALELAAHGQGRAEPNPMVGCVLVADGEVIGEGYHALYGGPHAEVAALAPLNGQAPGATAFVSLEPCCHHGKTPPCSKALIDAGVTHVVIAQRDPFPQVDGGGVAALEAAGIEVRCGLLEEEARQLNAPYLKLIETGRPWLIAKWAMTLDGHLATRTGDSRWISCEASREIVHDIRGRVDGVMVGRATAAADDPALTARPTGVRTALRIVVDTQASLALDSKLVTTAREVPVLIAAGEDASQASVNALEASGCEVFRCPGDTHAERLASLLDELGRRRLTNILVEGGAQLLGSLFDAQAVDEVHVFIAPKVLGSAQGESSFSAQGSELMSAAQSLLKPTVETSGDDVYVHGRLR